LKTRRRQWAPLRQLAFATWDWGDQSITINHDFSPVTSGLCCLKGEYGERLITTIRWRPQNVTFTVKDAAAPTVTFNPADLETGVS
jgi:hypothetical protein